MKRRTMTALLTGSAWTRAAWAAEAWTKDPGSWDEQDIQKLLTDSPWARKVQVAFGGGAGGAMPGGMGGGGMAADAGAEGGLSGPGGGPGGGMGGGGRRGGGMGSGMGGQARTVTYVVRWMSALPVKQAFVQARLGKEAGASEQARQYIARQETHYLVAVVGPARGAGMGGRGRPDGAGGTEEHSEKMAGHLREGTVLSRKGKPPIHPETIEMPKPGQGSYLFQFPKADAITEADKEVEFAARLGPFEIKRKFKLKDMFYQGALAL